MWFFICPKTGKHCRKLYSVGAMFLHREAFQHCMYRSQTYSHSDRILLKSFKKGFESEKIYEQIYSKYFRSHYAGKPTKRYLKLQEQIREIVPLSSYDLIFNPK